MNPESALSSHQVEILAPAVVRSYGSRALDYTYLGRIAFPSGKMLLTDPFSCLESSGNPHLQVTPGNYPVLCSWISDPETSSSWPYCLTVVFSEPLFRRRIRWQSQSSMSSKSPLIPNVWFTEVVPQPEFLPSGYVMIGDLDAVEEGMPADISAGMPGQSWYGALFDLSAPESWFGRIDSAEGKRPGSALIPMPGNGMLAAVCQAGAAPVRPRLFVERAFHAQSVSLPGLPDLDPEVIAMINEIHPQIALHLFFQDA